MTPVLRLVGALLWVAAILVFWLIAVVMAASFLGWTDR